MKRHELIDHLRRQGCPLERERSRHSEIDNRVAQKICRQLAVQPIR